MEEDEYRSTYHQVNQIRCAYEKAILSRRCACAHAHKFCLAEREGVSCQTKNNQERCLKFLQQARENALFVLKLTQLQNSPLPHAKEIRVQLGSLTGLSELLDGAEPETIADANDLLDRAERQYTDISNIPVETLVRAIKRMEARKKSRKTRNRD